MQPWIILAVLALFAGPITDASASANLSNDANTLDGTSWSLSGLDKQPLLPGSQVTIHFENGRVHGTDGCNRYSASYTAGDGRFKVGEEIVTTNMACPEPVMQQAAAFMRALSEASGYRRETRSLVLLAADGKEMAVFEAQSSELGGTSWLVTGYNNGKQAVVSVVAASELTAVFQSDGTLGGSAGCNTYTARYETSGKGIAIGPAATTFKRCAHPAGVMEQEAQYLKALETAATYRLDGSRLELRTAAGALAAVFAARADRAGMNSVPGREGAFPAVLRCGSRDIAVEYAKDRLRLTLGGETFDMGPVAAASGAKYAAVDDPTTTFWSKGDRGMLVLRGQPLPECTPVKTDPEAFRAWGNEPAWQLEITDTMMTLSADYGQTRIEAPTPTAETGAAFRRYVTGTGSHEVTVTIFDRPCADTMTGMPYPYGVAVVLDGKQMNGCGGDPASPAAGCRMGGGGSQPDRHHRSFESDAQLRDGWAHLGPRVLQHLYGGLHLDG